MKKPFLFLSDFDGTMSLEDFYTSFARGSLRDLDRSLLAKYRKREITSFEYLNTILMNINLTEAEIQECIHALPIDPFVEPVLATVVEHGGDFAVISAGADYYISPILKKIHRDIPLYANRGIFRNRGIEMSFPEDRTIHSPLYGIAKERVMAQLEKNYETVFFAGDGSGDFHAAKRADIRFAKARLAERLSEENCPYIPFDTFEDILTYLNRWIRENSLSGKAVE